MITEASPRFLTDYRSGATVRSLIVLPTLTSGGSEQPGTQDPPRAQHSAFNSKGTR
jgi:hypothetical protein